MNTITLNWTKLVEWVPLKFNQIDTDPEEGIPVLVSDINSPAK